MIVDDSWFSPKYHQLSRGQTAKTIIDYQEEFEQAQNEWSSMIVVKWKNALQLSPTIIEPHGPFDQDFKITFKGWSSSES